MPRDEIKKEKTPAEYVEDILTQAINTKASDVHLDLNPERNVLAMSLRIDGILYPIEDLSFSVPEEVVSRIKIMAEMDIMKHRMPQDGHIEFMYAGKKFNFRVSTTPTIDGEAVVLRSLNEQGSVVTDLSQLGFLPEQLEAITKMINSPYGMILITGPTGSGKTTLMYSFLGYLNKAERKILTIEDPVEYRMSNIRQMQINDVIGWTFGKGMRAVVRQDPDIIMLGEMRDRESAEIAMQAALTGKLVFSTFHTFDVTGIIVRLSEMDIPRSVIGHALNGVIFTRLVRKICDKCGVGYEPTEAERKILGDPKIKGNFRKGQGCNDCRQSGYSGRVGIFEVVAFDDEIKANIMGNQPPQVLRELLKNRHNVTMRESGIYRVQQGVTTVEEFVRIVGL